MFTDDDLYEIELSCDLFQVPRHPVNTSGPRQLRNIRRRKKTKTVTFSESRNEQEYDGSGAPIEILDASVVDKTKDTQPSHNPRQRPYVPEGEEPPVWRSPSHGDEMQMRLMRLSQLEKARGRTFRYITTMYRISVFGTCLPRQALLTRLMTPLSKGAIMIMSRLNHYASL